MQNSYLEGYVLMLGLLDTNIIEKFFVEIINLIMGSHISTENSSLLHMLYELYEDRTDFILWNTVLEKILFVLCNKLGYKIFRLWTNDSNVIMDVLQDLGCKSIDKAKLKHPIIHIEEMKTFILVHKNEELVSGYILEKNGMYLDQSEKRKLEIVSDCITDIYMSYN